ncbi:baseplate assembly protein [Alteromonadaceae bacterium M269]|nr:baseplate assembly protein [Alteromonadaceae bacterium M269]
MNIFPHQNPLPKPTVLQTPEFEQLLSDIKAKVVDHIRQFSESQANAVEETLANSAEVLTKCAEAFAVILQNHIRQWNDKALQMFGMYARDNDLVDVIVSSLNIHRQVITPGDPDAFPPVPAVMEDNDSLLTRYYLAAFALATTGTRLGYRFHLMTLGGRPETTIESPEPGKVVVTYGFKSHPFAGQIKDAQVRQVTPGVVEGYILTHEGDGVPEPALLAAALDYVTRDDIGQETDDISVNAPTIIPWNCNARIYVAPGADPGVRKAAAEKAIRQYGDRQHRLEGRIEPSVLVSFLVNESGALKADVLDPPVAILASFKEAPKLGNINITVIAE